jgi:hypothetical protein
VNLVDIVGNYHRELGIPTDKWIRFLALQDLPGNIPPRFKLIYGVCRGLRSPESLIEGRSIPEEEVAAGYKLPVEHVYRINEIVDRAIDKRLNRHRS